MFIPSEAVVAPSKLADYLLAARPWDDRSKFLAQAGFRRDRPEELESALRRIATEVEATENGANAYGRFWRVAGPLLGPNGTTLAVVAIWLQWDLDGTFHFVTLKPDRQRP